MGSPARFPGGVTTVRATNPLGEYGLPDPTRWHTYFEDFDTFTAGDWTITTTEAGTGSATEALTDADGGVLLVTNDDADNDADHFQKVGEGFLMAAGKKSVFKVRFKTSNATQTDLQFGLVITDTTPLDATDGIYFLKADDAATFVLICRKDATTGSTTTAALASLSDDTWHTLAWAYDGKAEIKAFLDDVHVGSLAVSSSYLPDTELTVSFCIVNGSAGAKTLSVDYLFAAAQRA